MELTSDDFKRHCATFYNRFMQCATNAQQVNPNANYNDICKNEMSDLESCATKL